MVDELRSVCAELAAISGHVQVRAERIGAYAQRLAPIVVAQSAAPPDPETVPALSGREELAAFWLTLDAINFGSGWFPTLDKRAGRTGYFTIAIGLRERFDQDGPWSCDELRVLSNAEIAAAVGQRSDHELVALFARSLRDLGAHVSELGGSFCGVIDDAGGSAVTLAERLLGWDCYADRSTYGGRSVPFGKRAQIAAADLEAAGVAEFADLARLTMFADNLVPHVLRLDGVLSYAPALLDRIERGELLEPGSPQEVEIRACALHAVELLAGRLPGRSPAEIDRTLWNRGQQPPYKAAPRHRCRSTAY